VREELGADIMCDCAEGSGWHGPLQKVLNYAWNSRSSQILALFCSHCTTHRKRSGFACARSLAALDISTQFVLHRMTETATQ